MSLIGKLVNKLLSKGSITLLTPGNAPETLGAGGGKHLTVRFTDRRVGFDIARNLRLGFGEAYMDGRLIIEDGTVLDLIEMVVGANRWEDGGEGRAVLTKGKRTLKRLLSTNNLKRARRNVAHHYDLKDELYDLFLDADKQYSCAYWTDPGHERSSRRSSTRRRISPPSWRWSPVSECSISAAAGAAWRCSCTRSPRSTCWG